MSSSKSSSSKTVIQQKTQEFWQSEKIWNPLQWNEEKSIKISQFILELYNNIPDKERIGKGKTFIVKAMTSGLFKKLFFTDYCFPSQLIQFADSLLAYADNHNDIALLYFGIHLWGEICCLDKDSCLIGLQRATIWGDHSNWEIRENSLIIIRQALKKYTNLTYTIMKDWVKDPNPNLRRFVSEGTRPMSDIKWLRDPAKNNQILEFLVELQADPNVVVRKSVGNNLKDLSKYMPEKILNWCQSRVYDAKIQIDDSLASMTKKELGSHNFYLIWTLKHALRWLNKRNPEYHSQIRNILGDNYVKHYHEKKNKLAIPK